MNLVEESINPPHWDLLSNEDKEIYKGIYQALSAPTNRNKRNKRIDDFREIVDAILLFIDQNEEDAWKRRLVCGICKLSNGIAVNIAQLRKLIFKCKASINGSLKMMGYDSVASKTTSCTELFEKIPYLKNNSAEMRQWTVRTSSNKKLEINNKSFITPPQPDFISAESTIDIFDLRLTNHQNTSPTAYQNFEISESHTNIDEDPLNQPFMDSNFDDMFPSF